MKAGILKLACSVFLFVASTAYAQVPSVTVNLQYARNPAGPEDGFYIERRPGPAGGTQPWVRIATLTPGVLTYKDTAVVAGTMYCYRAGAFNKAGTSYSTEVCDTPTVVLVIPNAPAITLIVSSVTGLQPLTVAWVAPPAPYKPSANDWVGLFDAVAPDTTHLLGKWKYTGGAASGVLSITPDKPGEYNARYMCCNGFTSITKSYTIRVQ